MKNRNGTFVAVLASRELKEKLLMTPYDDCQAMIAEPESFFFIDVFNVLKWQDYLMLLELSVYKQATRLTLVLDVGIKLRKQKYFSLM